MLKKIINAQRKVVSIQDPAVQAKLPKADLMRYALTRDFGIIEKVDFGADQPTVFTVRPLLTKHETLSTMPLYIFAMYVEQVENVDPSMAQFVERDGLKMLTDECCESYPREVRQEIGEVVVQLASRDGDLRPFTLPDTYQDLEQVQRRLHALKAASAITDPAS